ncbi:kainate selective glutamate receptor activity [Nesidiocoris tenuis]|uniref:Kainate selective glutamate receptor activity n=1 Tax=Nesidiocoris tenuis TaxID=355587 RepID=A0ABN7BC76_9HEMI|nr:kainate selective glutamate receptor activity [Nesidiocoris tenuis]
MASWLSWTVSFWCLSWASVLSEERQVYRIGAIFEEGDHWGRYAFKAAVKIVNEDSSILPGIELVPEIADRNVSQFGVFEVEQEVCKLMSKGVVAIVGPHSPATSNHVQSLCDTMEIPHISARWDPHQRRSSCLINLYPHPSVLAQASADIVRAWDWSGFTLLYDDSNALRRMSSMLKIADDKGYSIAVRQLKGKPGDEKNFRHIFQEIKHSEETNLVIEVNRNILFDVLLQAQQVGLIGADYNYIITSLDLHSIDLETFKWAGTNITGLRLVNTESSHYIEVMKLISDLKQQETTNLYQNKAILDSGKTRTSTDKKLNQKNHRDARVKTPETQYRQQREAEDIANPGIPPIEAMLVFDAVTLLAEAIRNLDLIEPRPIDCRVKESWESGYTVINYIKLSEEEGLTGVVKFDNEGFRTDFTLDILELTRNGLHVKGNWSRFGGVNIQRPEPEFDQIEEVDDLRNSTFIVLIALTHPYGMLKESSFALVGNDRFEGFGVDLIHELSEMTGFNYTFRVQEDKSSGNPVTLPNGTRVWNGMIGEVLAGRADLAIADITITRERERDADFTMPFMSLGISILYRKPMAAPPSLFSFLSPFSYEVWGYMLSAYLGVSFLLYVIARICSQEWTNPYPCIEEPVVLENQFSLMNALWFTIGSLMQQGSELAPIAVSTRMLASIWWFFTLIMVSSYTANLAAFLTIEQKVEVFRDVTELAKQDVIKYGAKKGGSTANFFRDSHDPTYQKMWQFMSANPDVMMESNEAGVDRVDNNLDYAFLMESTSIEYETERRCNLFRVGRELDEKGYGIVMRQNSTYRNVLSRSVVKLQERGKLNELKTKWWKEKRGGGSCQEDPPNDADDLGLDNVGGVFVVLLGGCIFAVFLAFGELFYDIYYREDKVSFKDELMYEIRFIMRCHGTERPNRKFRDNISSGSTSRSRSHLPTSTDLPSRSPTCV